MVQQLNEFKNSSDTFDAFHQKAKTVLTDYNTNWLRTEYETAHAVGRNASAWIHNEANKDLYPYLRYETVGDERVRAAHAALNGRKFKIGDEALTRIYPPNGFGCRCEMIPELGLDDGEEATTLETAVGLLGTDWDKMIKKGFDKNRGQLGYVFDASEEYIKAFNPNAITYKSYALNAFEHLPNKEKLPIEHIGRSKSLDWFKEQIGKNDLTDNNRIRLTDYRSRPIELLKTLVTQIADERNGFLLQLLEKTISEPSEVWLTQSESGYHRNYLSFYDKKCVTVTVSFNNEKNEIIQALTLLDKENATIDDIRKGILIHHKK
jgi:SPP1 gp7 family putative phage head morphogenesis protein